MKNITYRQKPDAHLYSGGSGHILLRDSIEGDEVLVELRTSSATTWLWFRKAELKKLINEFIEEE